MSLPPGQLIAGSPAPRWVSRVAVGLVAYIVLLYAAGVTNAWRPASDSALYLSVGRSLARGQGYQFNGAACTDVTPGLPYVLAAVRAAAGEVHWPANLLMAACGLAAAGAIYLAMRRLAGRTMAVAVTVIWALSYTTVLNSQRIMTDVPFALLFWLALGLALRGGWWMLALSAALSAAAAMIRAPGCLVIAPAALGLLMQGAGQLGRGRRVARAAAMLVPAAIVVGVFLLWASHARQETPLYGRIASHGMHLSPADLWRNLLAGAVKGPEAVALAFTSQRGMAFLPVGWLLVALAAVGLMRLWRRGQRIGPLVVVLYPLALLFVGGGPRAIRERYLLPVVPLVAWAVLEALEFLACRLARRVEPARAARVAVWGLVAFCVVCSTPRSLRDNVYFSWLAHTGRYHRLADGGKNARLMTLAGVLREQTAPGEPIALAGGDIRMVHYLADRHIVNLTPSSPSRSRPPSAAVEQDLPPVVAVDFDNYPQAHALVNTMQAHRRYRLLRREEGLAVFRRIDPGPPGKE